MRENKILRVENVKNRISLMIMKHEISETFRVNVSTKVTTTKDFLQEIEKYFVQNDKTEISMLLANLISFKFKGKINKWVSILEMSNVGSNLKALKLELSKDLLMHLVLISLPTQLNQFEVNYNC